MKLIPCRPTVPRLGAAFASTGLLGPLSRRTDGRRVLRQRRAALIWGTAFLGLALSWPAAAVVIGQRKPVCDEVRTLEGPLYVEIEDVEGGAPRYLQIRDGGTDPLVLIEGGTYRLGLRAGQARQAPAVPARYRVTGESFLTFFAWADGEGGLPLEREYSLNTLERLVIWARNPGRRKLLLRLSECWQGGGYFLRAPAETLIPVVVAPAGGAGGEETPGP